MITINIGEKIKALRCELDLTQEELAFAAKTTKQTIHKYETGIISNIPASKIKAMADKLGTTPSFLMGWDEKSTKTPAPNVTEDYTQFAVIGEVAAGYDHVGTEEWNGEIIDIPSAWLKGRNKNEFFVLKVCGDSMFPMYQDGDKVLVLKQSTLNYSGQVGVLLYDDEYTSLKRVEYKMGEDWFRAVPVNPTYPAKKVEGAELEHCRILGIPKMLIREIDD